MLETIKTNVYARQIQVNIIFEYNKHLLKQLKNENLKLADQNNRLNNAPPPSTTPSA
jgi:hypothetical protein